MDGSVFDKITEHALVPYTSNRTSAPSPVPTFTHGVPGNRTYIASTAGYPFGNTSVIIAASPVTYKTPHDEESSSQRHETTDDTELTSDIG